MRTKNCINIIEALDSLEDEVEASWKINIEDFPSFFDIGDKDDACFKSGLYEKINTSNIV